MVNMVKKILKVLKKNQIHLKKAIVCVITMALILQSLVYYGQNYTLDAKATENQRVNMTATTSGDAKAIPLNSSGADSLKEDGLETDSAQGDSSGTDSSTGMEEGSATENSTGTGNDSAENQDATTSGDAKADDSETDALEPDVFLCLFSVFLSQKTPSLYPWINMSLSASRSLFAPHRQYS